MKLPKFLIRKSAIFRKVKEIKHLSGGVVLYAAQTNVQLDAEIVEKGSFRAETWRLSDFADRNEKSTDRGEIFVDLRANSTAIRRKYTEI